MVRLVLVVVVALGVALYVLAREASRDGAAAIVTGLCGGLDEIAEGGVARDIYVDRVHKPIHALEARVVRGALDPLPLRETNEWLETSLDGHTGDVPGAIRATVAEVRRAAIALEEPDPGGCD